MENLITCKICGKESTRIYGRHLKHHNLTSDEYLKLYPGELLYTEYNSDMYHANPINWKNNDNPHTYRKWLKYEDIWKHNKEKFLAAEKKNFSVLIIWESDYKNDSEKIKNV